MSRNKPLVFVVTCAFIFITACLGVSGCGTTTKAGKFKVGVILSLSGPAAPLGQSEQRSINLLKSQLDKQGGINGQPVEFIIQDDESDPAKASVAANKLIQQDKVPVLIGCSSSGSTLAIMPIAEKAQVPVVAMAAGTPVTQPVKKYIFSVAPSDTLVIQRALMYFKDEIKIQRISVLHDANAYGTGGADQVKAMAPKYNIAIVADESYGSADTDMTPQLTKIAQTNAQAILVWGTNPGPASIAKNMQQLGMKIPFVGSSGIANKTFINLAGSAANGVVFPASRLILPQTIPAGSQWAKTVQSFSAAYKQAYNQDIDTFAAHGWDSSNIVVNALKVAGDNSAEIRNQIEKLKDYPGADGVFNYSPTNHAGLKVDALVMVLIQNGQWVQAKP
ncbi:MAG TPA: ABC transporter substrate-binding protein [Candidatus Anoxymicrobiaceae bacterium]